MRSAPSFAPPVPRPAYPVYGPRRQAIAQPPSAPNGSPDAAGSIENRMVASGTPYEGTTLRQILQAVCPNIGARRSQTTHNLLQYVGDRAFVGHFHTSALSGAVILDASLVLFLSLDARHPIELQGLPLPIGGRCPFSLAFVGPGHH